MPTAALQVRAGCVPAREGERLGEGVCVGGGCVPTAVPSLSPRCPYRCPYRTPRNKRLSLKSLLCKKGGGVFVCMCV